jgi:hypothetical protein
VEIGNGTSARPNGDTRQTVELWTPPKVFEDLPVDVANDILNVIAAGLDNEQRYSEANGAHERAAWSVVRQHCPNKDAKDCRKVIKQWLEVGVLYSKKYLDPIQRREVGGLFVDEQKRPV